MRRAPTKNFSPKHNDDSLLCPLFINPVSSLFLTCAINIASISFRTSEKFKKKNNDINVYGEKSLYTGAAAATFLFKKNKIIYINVRLMIENGLRTKMLSWTRAYVIWFPLKDRIVVGEAPLDCLFQSLGTLATRVRLCYSYGVSTTTDVVIGVPASRYH